MESLSRTVNAAPQGSSPAPGGLARALSALGLGEHVHRGSLRPSNLVASASRGLDLPLTLAVSVEQLRELQCAVCEKLIEGPVYAPCGHSFCHRHLAEGAAAKRGEEELDSTAALVRRLCGELGFPVTRAREALAASPADAGLAESICRQAAGIEGKAVRVRADVTEPQFSWGAVTKKSLGRVARVEGGHAHVDFEDQNRWHCLVSELEVDEVADGVRTGATVRVRKGVWPKLGWGALEGGAVGEVVLFREARVCVASAGTMWYGFLGELEPAPGLLNAVADAAAVDGAALKAALQECEPQETCRAALASVLNEAAAAAEGGPVRVMLRGDRRMAIMCTYGAMGVLSFAGFKVCTWDSFRTRALIESVAKDAPSRAKSVLDALEAEFGKSPALCDDDDMRFQVSITVDKSEASEEDFEKYWTGTLQPKLVLAFAPAKGSWTWARKGWENEDALKKHLGDHMLGGPTAVARGQTRRDAKQIASSLESQGLVVAVAEQGKVQGLEVAAGEDPAHISVPTTWEGPVPKGARVRLVDLPEEHALITSVGTSLVGIVAGQYNNSQEGLSLVVNFPGVQAKQVKAENLKVDETVDTIQVGARVKVKSSSDGPKFGWQDVETSDVGVVHAVCFDGTVWVYFQHIEKLFVATLNELSTEDLPQTTKGNCPVCHEPLLRGEHLATDMAVEAQLRRIRRLMEGERKERNDAPGANPKSAPRFPKLQRSDTQKEELTCSICLDLMVSPVTLGCGHSFCKSHIEAWLLQHHSCPNCKRRVVAERLHKRRTKQPRKALFDSELQDAEKREPGGDAEEQAAKGAVEEYMEFPVNRMLESQVVRAYGKDIEGRNAEIAGEVWDSLQRRERGYLHRLRGFMKHSNALAVKQLVEQGFTDVDAKLPGTYGGTLLMLSAEQGLTGAVDELLQRRADPLAVTNASQDVGATALSLAAAQGHKDALSKLLSVVEWPVVRLADAISAAVEQQHCECLEVLLKHHGGAVELHNSYGFPALVTATQTNSKNVLRTLVDHKAELESTLHSGILVSGAGIALLNGVYQRAGTFEGKPYYQNGNGAVMYCKDWWKITQGLKPEGTAQGWYYSMPEPRSETPEPPKGMWTTHGYEGLDAPPAPTAEHLGSEQGGTVTPLLLAVQLGFVEFANGLLEAGANPCARMPGTGAQVLQVACVGGDLAMVRMLLLSKASATDADAQGRAPLHTACGAGHHLLIAELLKASVSPDSEHVPTPLMLASCCGSYPPGPGKLWKASASEKYALVVDALLAARADANRCADDGAYVLHIAAKAGASKKVLDKLLAANADPTALDAGGRTPFFAALLAGRSATACSLVEVGASEESLSMQCGGFTPLSAVALLGDIPLLESVLAKLKQLSPETYAKALQTAETTHKDLSVGFVRLTSTGLDTNIWQLVPEPMLAPDEEVACIAANTEVGEKVLLSHAFSAIGHAAKGPLKPGDVGTVIKKDGGKVPLQVKFKDSAFWYRDGAVCKYSTKTSTVNDFTGHFSHPYISSGKTIGLRVLLDTESTGRWLASEDGVLEAQGASITLSRDGRGITICDEASAMELVGRCDELDNIRGEVVVMRHRAGKFALAPTDRDATVRCPSGHAAFRNNGLSSRRATCDVCSKSVAREAPLYFTCHTCNYDVCSSCCSAPLLARLPAEQPVHLGSWSPLHFAAAAGHSDVVSALLSARSDPLVKDRSGRTPLHWASAAGSGFVVESLLTQEAAGSTESAAAAEDVYGLTALRLAPAEMLRFAGKDGDQVWGPIAQVGRPAAGAPGDADAAGIYAIDGFRDERPIYKRSDGRGKPGWAICWDAQTARWGVYLDRYDASCIQYQSKQDTPKCPTQGWVSVIAPDPVPAFEEYMPWRAGASLLAATPISARLKPHELKSLSDALPSIEPHHHSRALVINRTNSGGIQIAIPEGGPPPQEFLAQLIMEMIRRGDLPAEPPPGCVQQ